MTAELIDSDVLFQALLMEGEIVPAGQVAAEVDVDTFDAIPFVTHSSLIAQDGNGRGLWTATLQLTAFTDGTVSAFNAVVRPLYALVHSWGELPTNGIVPGVGAVERVQDIQAFNRQGKGVPMNNKTVVPYVGSFELSIRNHI